MSQFVAVDTIARFSPDKMQKNNLFTTANLFCDVYCLEPGQEQASHLHVESDKLYYVVEGTPHIRIGSEERPVGPRTVALAPAGSAHGVRNPGPDRAKLLVIMTPRPK